MGGGEQKTESTTIPWKGVQPYIKDALERASAESKTDKQYYPEQTYADLSGDTLAAQDALRQSGSTVDPFTAQSKQYASDTLSGKYLGEENPYLAKMTQTLTDRIGSTVGDRFAASGGYMGSQGEVQTVAREVSEAANPYYFQAYENERNRMGEAAGMAPMFEQLEYADINKLLQSGQITEAQQQKMIDDAKSRWDFEQNEEQNQLSWLADMLGVGTGYQSTSTSSKSSDGGSGAMAAGAGMISTLALAAAIMLS